MVDERGQAIQGEVILQRDIMPKVSTMVSNLKGHHGTFKFIKRTVCSETCNMWRSLRDDVSSMLIAAKESRENPERRIPVVSTRPASSILRRTSVGPGSADGQGLCRLKQHFSFEQKNVLNYRIEHSSGELVPFHAYPDKKTWVRVYSGDFRGLVKAEGEQFSVNVAYTDPPWNIHAGRVEDEKILTPQQVSTANYLRSISP